jgi:methylated-DNA-[protein]-cysteine S-methyltransferase
MNERSAAALFDTPVGFLLARAESGLLAELSFVDGPQRERPCETHDEESSLVVTAVERQISEYFEGRRTAFDIPVKLAGPSFHLRVWKALQDIPYGTTMSYGQLAKQVGEPDAARAVGTANAANRIVIIVPCHRVIGANGRLVGYGGGLGRKRILLDLEGGRAALDLAPA